MYSKFQCKLQPVWLLLAATMHSFRCTALLLQLVISHGGQFDAALLDTIAAALSKAGLQERCGDLYQHLGRSLEALQAFRQAHAYRCGHLP